MFICTGCKSHVESVCSHDSLGIISQSLQHGCNLEFDITRHNQMNFTHFGGGAGNVHDTTTNTGEHAITSGGLGEMFD